MGVARDWSAVRGAVMEAKCKVLRLWWASCAGLEWLMRAAKSGEFGCPGRCCGVRARGLTGGAEGHVKGSLGDGDRRVEVGSAPLSEGILGRCLLPIGRGGSSWGCRSVGGGAGLEGGPSSPSSPSSSAISSSDVTSALPDVRLSSSMTVLVVLDESEVLSGRGSPRASCAVSSIVGRAVANFLATFMKWAMMLCKPSAVMACRYVCGSSCDYCSYLVVWLQIGALGSSCDYCSFLVVWLQMGALARGEPGILMSVLGIQGVTDERSGKNVPVSALIQSRTNLKGLLPVPAQWCRAHALPVASVCVAACNTGRSSGALLIGTQLPARKQAQSRDTLTTCWTTTAPAAGGWLNIFHARTMAGRAGSSATQSCACGRPAAVAPPLQGLPQSLAQNPRSEVPGTRHGHGKKGARGFISMDCNNEQWCQQEVMANTCVAMHLWCTFPTDGIPSKA
eukprot:1159460-Pelagomonas_calceolata.AAC.4